jgi:hypothetical protein
MSDEKDILKQKVQAPPVYTAFDIVKDIIFFFVVVAVAFGWLLLMLLIISFVALSYLHMKFDYMILASVIFAIIAGIVYIIVKSRKYVRLNDEKRRRKREDT